MSIDTTVRHLLNALDERTHHLAELDRYYAGRQAMAFLSPEARLPVGSRFGRLGVNIPRLAVNSLNERLRVTGFRLDDRPAPTLWGARIRHDLDQRAAPVHREALVLGRSYVITWAHPDGTPLIPRSLAVLRPPADRAPPQVHPQPDPPNRGCGLSRRRQGRSLP